MTQGRIYWSTNGLVDTVPAYQPKKLKNSITCEFFFFKFYKTWYARQSQTFTNEELVLQKSGNNFSHQLKST